MKAEVNQLDSSIGQYVGFRKSLLKAMICSITATTVDFIFALALANLFNVYYVTANFIGGMMGAFTSFNLSRRWVFRKRQDNMYLQIFKFVLIHFISISFNSTCVYLVKENMGFSFEVSKTIVAVCFSFFFNFLMNRFFVFKTWRKK